MQSHFRVQVSKDYLVFASAHFITFRGHQCETLHGHNYRVGVAVEGSVDAEAFFVLDFSVLKQITPGHDCQSVCPVSLALPGNPSCLSRGRRPPAVDYFGVPAVFLDATVLLPSEQYRRMLAQYAGSAQVRDELNRATTVT